eukprot:1175917-Amphidinium_carterae.1
MVDFGVIRLVQEYSRPSKPQEWLPTKPRQRRDNKWSREVTPRDAAAGLRDQPTVMVDLPPLEQELSRQ